MEKLKIIARGACRGFALAELLAIIVILTILVGVATRASAAETPDRLTATIAAGAVTVENTNEYGRVFAVDAIEVFGAQPATFTGAVKLVDSTLTNSITAALVGTGGYAGYRPTNTTYVFRSAELSGTALGTNAGTFRLIGRWLP